MKGLEKSIGPGQRRARQPLQAPTGISLFLLCKEQSKLFLTHCYFQDKISCCLGTMGGQGWPQLQRGQLEWVMLPGALRNATRIQAPGSVQVMVGKRGLGPCRTKGLRPSLRRPWRQQKTRWEVEMRGSASNMKLTTDSSSIKKGFKALLPGWRCSSTGLSSWKPGVAVLTGRKAHRIETSCLHPTLHQLQKDRAQCPSC